MPRPVAGTVVSTVTTEDGTLVPAIAESGNSAIPASANSLAVSMVQLFTQLLPNIFEPPKVRLFAAYCFVPCCGFRIDLRRRPYHMAREAGRVWSKRLSRQSRLEVVLHPKFNDARTHLEG